MASPALAPQSVTTLDDLSLAQMAAQGDPGAFNEIYARYRETVLTYCAMRTLDRARAEDHAQETWIMVFRKIHQFQGKSRFSTWLYKVARSQVFMALRKKEHHQIHISLDGPVGDKRIRSRLAKPSDETVIVRKLDHERDAEKIMAAVAGLPPKMKLVFVLHQIEDRECKEIAEMLGKTTGGIKSIYSKALAKLRIDLRQRVPEQ